MNGSRIQDLDLKKVPSMRRNEIISDIFSRLHYMDKRGSGIRRILNSYIDFVEKPEFYSNEYFFLVILPNRGEANRVKVQENEEMQLSNGEMQLSLNKQAERELRAWLVSEVSGKFKPSIIEKLAQLLLNYTFRYPLNRHNVASSFNISENAASRILKKPLSVVLCARKSEEYIILLVKIRQLRNEWGYFKIVIYFNVRRETT